jgi:hypothetical protein
MPLKFTQINDIILIDLAENQAYKFSEPTLEGGCDDVLRTSNQKLELPVYQSYQKDPSKGLQLKAKMSMKNSLLNQLFDIDLDDDPPITIDAWNADEVIDVFPTAKTAVIVAETIRAKMPYTFATGWPDIVADAIVKEVANIKNAGGRSSGSKFTDAVNEAMYENRSPQQKLTSVMKMRTFCVQAGRGLLGLGTNAGTPAAPAFVYNFGASLLFNPKLYITEKGKGRIYMEGKYYPGRSDRPSGKPEPVCGKAIVLYNSTRDNTTTSIANSNLSFAFRPDDTFSDENAVANEIMAAARTLTDTDITENQLAAAKMTEANWKGGKPWTSSPVIIQGGLKYKVALNAPQDRGAGIFNVQFSFNFGTENGSLTLSNLLLSFTFDIANYAAAVNAVQQMNARVREAYNNYRSQLATRAAALAAANKTAGAAPLTDVSLNTGGNTSNNLVTRDQNAADTYKDGTDIFDGTTVPSGVPNPNYTNDKQDARIINGDPLGDI